MHQVTAANSGPVHRTSKLLFDFVSRHRRLFQSRDYTFELWLHVISTYEEQREREPGRKSFATFPENNDIS